MGVVRGLDGIKPVVCGKDLPCFEHTRSGINEGPGRDGRLSEAAQRGVASKPSGSIWNSPVHIEEYL